MPRHAGLESAVRQWGSLLQRLKVLLISSQEGFADWLTDSLSIDRATTVAMQTCLTSSDAMAVLRSESFDAVFVRHDPPNLDGCELSDALRSSGHDLPLLILGSAPEALWCPLALDSGADAYVCIPATTTRMLLWTVSRAVERRELLRENQRLEQARAQRLRYEQQEAQRQIEEMRALLSARTAPVSSDGSIHQHTAEDSMLPLPPDLVQTYHDLLRAQVIMGSGSLAGEVDGLMERIGQVSPAAQQVLELHLGGLETLVRGLGSRSARNVIQRADLLLYETMARMCDDYRRRAAAGEVAAAGGDGCSIPPTTGRCP